MTLHLDRVLLVEDDPSAVKIIVSYWPDWGWVLAETFHEAVQLIDRDNNGYDLIMLDLTLPDSLGFDTLARIRKSSVAPIIICTGSDPEEYRKRSNEFGVYGIIHKGSWVRHRVEAVVEGAIAKWKVEKYERATDILREERRKWRTEFLGHEH